MIMNVMFTLNIYSNSNIINNTAIDIDSDID